VNDERTTLGRSSRIDLALSPAARAELDALGLAHAAGSAERRASGVDPAAGSRPIPTRAISAPDLLNEAYAYSSSFSRGVRIDLPGASMLFLSGTASVDENGDTVHEGDFAAQCLRTYRNLAGLLAAEGASWHDVVKTTCYLRDIERDYAAFNEIRTMFMTAAGLDPLPASVGVQARLCRSDLLVEIEALAIIARDRGPEQD
jgi:enamine deaminase RidA (YjgF/YER057c/UK114 family)